MRDCPDGTVRDSLPLYVSERLAPADHATVETHLRGCADCAAEVELLRAVSRAYPPTVLDVAAITAKLPARRHVRMAVPFHRQPLWRVAAGLTLFIAGTATVMVVRGRAPQATVVATSSAGTAAAETTLASADVPTTVAPSSNALLSLGTDLSDLSDAQLESLLGSLDGLDPRPQADPMTIATPIIQDRTQAPGRSNQ